MILYSKRTALNAFNEDAIAPNIVYIYWDFDKRKGGHLDKNRNIVSKPGYLLFNDVDNFYRWRNTYKDYWEEPTRSIIEDYLQVDEGL